MTMDEEVDKLIKQLESMTVTEEMVNKMNQSYLYSKGISNEPLD